MSPHDVNVYILTLYFLVETNADSKSFNPNTFYWSFDLEEKLILKIRENPCLYDIEHHDFKNSAARNLCIHKIAQHLGCGEYRRYCEEIELNLHYINWFWTPGLFDVAKKYRELREQYVEESKSLATGSEPLWPLFHAMGFLKGSIRADSTNRWRGHLLESKILLTVGWYIHNIIPLKRIFDLVN